MITENQKEEAKARLAHYLEARGIDSARPFRCLNPDHEDKNPSMSYDQRAHRVKCFACGASYDLFDLIALDTDLTGAAIFRAGCEAVGVRTDDQRQQPAKPVKKEARETDYTDYYRTCQSRTERFDYLTSRGISVAVQERFGIGYDPALYFSRDAGKLPAVVIPISASSYIARATVETAHNARHTKRGSGFFNLQAIKSAARPVWITEGAIDALSVIEAGGEAVGLNSAENADNFIRRLRQTGDRPAVGFVIAMDEDDSGRAAAEKLAKGLQELKIACCRAEATGAGKDANERLMRDRVALAAYIAAQEERLREAAEKVGREISAEEMEIAECSMTAACLDLERDINEGLFVQPISTGLNVLDSVLDGGLYPGLYIIGAVSSLGKTALCLQIAEHIATADPPQDVLYFSLEMTRRQLALRIVSRYTYTISKAEGKRRGANGYPLTARTANSVRRGDYVDDKEAVQIVGRAIMKTSRADRLYIYEGAKTAKEVEAAVNRYIAVKQSKPVVFIDYLQYLRPEEGARDPRLSINAAVETVKCIADKGMTVICISSFNRASYSADAAPDSFKESGNIEYTADCLIALQTAAAQQTAATAFEARQKAAAKTREINRDISEGKCKEIEVKILKSRDGPQDSAYLRYYPMFGLYEDGKPPEEKPNAFRPV